MAGSVEFLVVGLNTSSIYVRTLDVVTGEQGLEFADDLLGGSFRDQVAFDFQLERLLEEPGSIGPYHRERPRRIYVSFWQKALTSLMGALRHQSPALLAVGAFGGELSSGSYSLPDSNSFFRG